MKTETVYDIAREMREGVIANGWMEQTLREFADRIEAAARNATMLCHQVCSCELLAKMETENARLRALVGELADALGCMLCDYDCVIHGECPASIKKEECELFKIRVLVARAREVTK